MGSQSTAGSLSAQVTDAPAAIPVADPSASASAPSPTGLLHVGGVRTALYNWLYARHDGGRFVLRIEDTDETRENPEAIEQIQRSLRWFGLDWDEGPGVGGPHAPYLQSERRPRHHEVAEQLLAEGRPTAATAPPRSSPPSAQAAQREGRPFDLLAPLPRARRGGARRARGRGRRRRRSGLRIPDEGEFVVDDLVRGEVRFENALLGDHVIVRSDGVPTYNFVNPLDDAAMGITHVIRGDDLLRSTPRQVLVYRALGAPVPRFAHLSLILGPDRKRLSKRHGATSVEQLREAGYLPEAVVNFLALLGWSFDGERELFTLDELVGLFSLERVNPAPAVFDAKKLVWMNGVHLRALPTFDLAERLVAYLGELGSPLAAQPERVAEVDAAGAGEDRDAGRVRAALLVPLRARSRSTRRPGSEWPGTSAPPRSWQPCRPRSRPASGRGGGRGDPARRLRASWRSSRASSSADPHRPNGHDHLARPVRERPPARPRRDAGAPLGSRRPPGARGGRKGGAPGRGNRWGMARNGEVEEWSPG